VALLKPELLQTVLWPAAAACAVLLASSAVLLWPAQGDAAQGSGLELHSPFELGTVLKLAGLIALIMLVAKLVTDKVGAGGLYLLAAASGIADVDALTLSMARFAGGQVGLAEAGTAILVAAGVNTASKAAMATAIGGSRLGWIVGGASAASLAAMALALFLVRAI
jgi:uncharacterized membrane protein (DUF4010 family)